MLAVQSKIGPFQLRGTNEKIKKFDNERKELLKALNHFIEESTDSIVLEQIKGEKYAKWISLSRHAIMIGAGIMGLTFTILSPPVGLAAHVVYGAAPIVIQLG